MRNHLLSQHFLRSPHLALILIGHSNLKKRDTVVEIGAGSGVITSALAHRVHHVIAIEPDHATAEKLRANLKKRNLDNVEIIKRDFLDYTLPSTPYKVFSNPPFRLSSKIVHKLIEANNNFITLKEKYKELKENEDIISITKKINEIDENCKQTKCTFLMNKEELKVGINPLFNQEIGNYINNNYKEIDKISIYTVYSNEV